MALGKQKDEQQEMWVATTSLPNSQGHVFYRKLNGCSPKPASIAWPRNCAGELLSRPHWRAVDSAGGVLPHVAGGLLQGPRLATRHRIALRRQPFAARVLGIPLVQYTPTIRA